MNLNSINITEIVEQTKTQLQEDKTLSPALKMSKSEFQSLLSQFFFG